MKSSVHFLYQHKYFSHSFHTSRYDFFFFFFFFFVVVVFVVLSCNG